MRLVSWLTCSDLVTVSCLLKSIEAGKANVLVGGWWAESSMMGRRVERYAVPAMPTAPAVK